MKLLQQRDRLVTSNCSHRYAAYVKALLVSGTAAAPWGLFATASVASPMARVAGFTHAANPEALDTLPQLDTRSHRMVAAKSLVDRQPVAIAAPERIEPASDRPIAATPLTARQPVAIAAPERIAPLFSRRIAAPRAAIPIAPEREPELQSAKLQNTELENLEIQSAELPAAKLSENSTLLGTPTELKAFIKHDRGTVQQLTQPAPAEILAQTPEVNSVTLNPDADASLRQRLLIKPLVELRVPGFAPASTAGGPTAFGANWGDAFVGLSLANRRARANEADGAMSLGFGLGDSQTAVGFEVGINIGSLRKFANNGDVLLKLHRSLPGKAAIAIGWDSALSWGPENRNTKDTVYGVFSKVFDLQPNDLDNTLPLTFSVGLGNGRFRTVDALRNDRPSVNVFASLGLQVTPRISLVSTWTGQDLNLGITTVPWRDTPLFVSVVVANVFGNNDNATLFSLNVGYGFNFLGQRR